MRGTESAVKRVLWWVCLLVAPAVLVGIELFHPSHFTEQPGMYQLLSHANHDQLHFHALAYFGPHWWFMLHMIQTPMVGLVAVGWMWLRLAQAALGEASDPFCAAKLVTARHYARRALPEAVTLRRRVEAGAETLMALPPEAFAPSA